MSEFPSHSFIFRKELIRQMHSFTILQDILESCCPLQPHRNAALERRVLTFGKTDAAAASVQHLSAVLCTAAEESAPLKTLLRKTCARSKGWFLDRDSLKMKHQTVVNTSGQFHTADFNAPALLKRQLLHAHTAANMGQRHYTASVE